MLSFKEFLQEKVLDQYGGKKLFSTFHLNDRVATRGASPDEIKDIFHKAVDHLNNNDYEGHSKFLFYSKKHDRAVVFDHRRDRFSNDPRRHLVACTVFDKGQKHANPQTKLITVESRYSPEFNQYVDSFITEEQKNVYPLSEVIVDGVEFYYLNGELNNLPFTEVVEVE